MQSVDIPKKTANNIPKIEIESITESTKKLKFIVQAMIQKNQ